MSTNALGQLFGREQAISFHNRLLGMDPARLNGIEPGTLSGQEEGHNTDSFARLFNLLVVFANPGTYQQTSMPRGIVPDQEPVVLALSSQALTTILQKLDADRTHRPSRDKAHPDLRTVRILRRSGLPQDAIASQGLGIRIIFLPALFDQAKRLLCTLLGLQLWLSKAAPPHFIEEAQRPLRVLTGVHNQAVTSFFFPSVQ